MFAPLKAAELGKTPIVWEADVVVLDELPVGVRLPVILPILNYLSPPNPLYSLLWLASLSIPLLLIYF